MFVEKKGQISGMGNCDDDHDADYVVLWAMFSALGHLLYSGHLRSLPLKENLKSLKVQGPVWL